MSAAVPIPSNTGGAQPTTCPLLGRLPGELRLIIFENMVEDHYNKRNRVIEMTRASATIHEFHDIFSGKTSVKTQVKIRRLKDTDDFFWIMAHLCRHSRKVVTGYNVVMYQPTLADFPLGRTRSSRRHFATVPIMQGSTRDVVLHFFPGWNNAGGANQIDGAKLLDTMAKTLGQKVERIHLADRLWSYPSSVPSDRLSNSVDRRYRIGGRGRVSYTAPGSLETMITRNFPGLPDMNLTQAQADAGPAVTGVGFNDRDTPAFDFGSVDFEHHFNRSQFHAEILRMYSNGRISVNTDITGLLWRGNHLPRVATQIRLQQVYDLAVERFPKLEYISVLSRFTPR